MVNLSTEKIGFNERLFLLVSRQPLTLRQQGFAANVLVHNVFCTGCVKK